MSNQSLFELESVSGDMEERVQNGLLPAVSPLLCQFCHSAQQNSCSRRHQQNNGRPWQGADLSQCDSAHCLALYSEHYHSPGNEPLKLCAVRSLRAAPQNENCPADGTWVGRTEQNRLNWSKICPKADDRKHELDEIRHFVFCFGTICSPLIQSSLRCWSVLCNSWCRASEDQNASPSRPPHILVYAEPLNPTVSILASFCSSLMSKLKHLYVGDPF